MKIYNIEDLNRFFDVVNKTKGKVELVSPDGDRINLKSQLCKYIAFSKLLNDNVMIKELDIVCHDPEDSQLFIRYMMGE